MQHPAPSLGIWSYLIPAIAIGLVIIRNARARRLRTETLWISPLAILLLVGLALGQEGAPSPAQLGLDIAALFVGAGLGWWRGRFTHITVDPETHQLTSRASPFGMLLILAIFALRYGLRTMATESAGAMHMSVRAVADAALVVTVGLVCAQRLEIALRATRLLDAARAAKAA